MACAILAQALLWVPGTQSDLKTPIFCFFELNPVQAMASSATSATSFELIEDQTLTVEEIEMASQEAQDIRTREAAVAAGLVLDEPEVPPSASATDVMNNLSSALERLQVAFATPTPGLGAPGPAKEGDRWGMRTGRSGPHHRRKRRRHPRRD